MDLPMQQRAVERPPSAATDACPQQGRRVAAVGVIRRTRGRTTRLTATPAGITGSIRPAVAR